MRMPVGAEKADFYPSDAADFADPVCLFLLLGNDAGYCWPFPKDQKAPQTMLQYLDQVDKWLFLQLNGIHVPWADPIMWTFSAVKVWIPLYLVIIAFVIYRFQWKSWIPLLGFGLVVLLSDQVSLRFKHGTMRPRPSHDTELRSQVHVLKDERGREYRGGAHGFFSGHAANSFGVATMTWLVLARSWWAWMFLWAFLVSYSRIYLGVHYPGDITVGAASGVLWAYLVYYLMVKKLLSRFES